MTIAESIARVALEVGAIRINVQQPFTWASGYKMPIYNDNRLLLGNAQNRALVTKGFQDLLKKNTTEVEVIAGTATAGIPHATTLADLLQVPLVYVRSRAKSHGMGNKIEGILKKNQKVLVIEDLISTGGSAVNAVTTVREAGGIVDHCFDLVIGQTTRCLDADLLLFARRLVLGGDIDDAVGIDIKSNFNLRHTAGGGGQTNQIELTQQLVISRHFTFALENPNGYRRLAVFSGGEGLTLLGRDRRVTLYQLGEDTAQGLNTQGQRRHIQQQYVFHIALQDTGLNGGTQCDHFVGVHALVGLPAKEGFDGLDDLGHAGHAADQNHFVNLTRAHGGIFQGCLQGRNGPLDQIIDQSFQFGAGDLHGQMFRAALISGDKGQVDLCLHGG